MVTQTSSEKHQMSVFFALSVENVRRNIMVSFQIDSTNQSALQWGIFRRRSELVGTCTIENLPSPKLTGLGYITSGLGRVLKASAGLFSKFQMTSLH